MDWSRTNGIKSSTASGMTGDTADPDGDNSTATSASGFSFPVNEELDGINSSFTGKENPEALVAVELSPSGSAVSPVIPLAVDDFIPLVRLQSIYNLDQDR